MMTSSSSFFVCSHSARTEVRILASVDLVLSLVYVVLSLVLCYFVLAHPDLVREFIAETSGGTGGGNTSSSPSDDDSAGVPGDLGKVLEYGRVKQGVVLALFVLRPTVSLVIAAVLIAGAHKRSYVVVRLLLVVLVVFIVVDLVLLVPRTIYTSNGKAYVLLYLVNFLWVLYELRAVYILAAELKLLWEEQQQKEQPTEEEEPADPSGSAVAVAAAAGAAAAVAVAVAAQQQSESSDVVE